MKYSLIPDAISKRAKPIKLLLMDCDGVLTDGRLYYSADGEALKVFDSHDGQGLVSWHRSGGISGLISGRGAHKIIQCRCDELGIGHLRTSSTDKIADCKEIAAELGISLADTAFIGDDLGDLGVMSAVGLAIAVADAVDEVRSAAHYVTDLRGGRGAVREVTDLLLKAKRDAQLSL
jgi:3-deoxy-D-manno-octulosonate 8-phosphate phosphatase (KDO 8-P phosphatase)